MSVIARVYITVVIAAGAAALGHSLLLWSPADLVRFLCYMVLAIPASCLKVPLPRVTGTMSVMFLFLLAGIVELGLPETVIIGSVCVLVQSFWHARVRPRAVQIAFSVANIAFAITAAYYAYHSRLLQVPYIQKPFRLALGASVFFVFNTYPIAIVIALTERKSIRRVWRDCYCWTFPYYLVGAAFVGVFTFANRLLDWQAWLLILPVVYAIYRSYRLYLDRLQAEHTRAEDERKHAEEVARLHGHAIESLGSAMRTKSKLNSVIQASPLAMLALDRDGKVTTWNTAAETMFGWSCEEVLGSPLPFAGGDGAKLIQSLVDRTLGGETIPVVEATQWRKDGSSFEAVIWTAPLRDGTDGLAGTLINVADVSDRKRLEEQLRLSQKMEAVGRLAGGVAHDFNNLLTVINGYSSMLIGSIQDNAYAAAQAEEILTAGTRAAELVSQLLAFSRRQVIKPKPLELNQVVQDVQRMLRRIIGEHIELQTLLAPDTGWIHADLNQMQAALLNLATNARDAMPRGGVLSIETSRCNIAAGQPSPVRDLPPGSYCRLVVKDNGHGMDFETQQHVFEPFFTTKQIGKGTGLGLSSVYGAVQQNNGRIFVKSEIGNGTVFSIYLPRLQREEARPLGREPMQEIVRGRETILLVEDESAVRRMLREALSHAGYRVWEAANGSEAVHQWCAKLNQIDLLVTDVVMPLMNGMQLAAEFQGRRPDLRVVFMSGHADDVITAQNDGKATPDLLQKPFVPDVLVKKVRDVLDRCENSAGGTSGDGRCDPHAALHLR